jgi:hypothetical protein
VDAPVEKADLGRGGRWDEPHDCGDDTGGGEDSKTT